MRLHNLQIVPGTAGRRVWGTEVYLHYSQTSALNAGESLASAHVTARVNKHHSRLYRVK